MQTEKGEKIINRNGPQLKRATAPCVLDTVVDANGGVWGWGRIKIGNWADRPLGDTEKWPQELFLPAPHLGSLLLGYNNITVHC